MSHICSCAPEFIGFKKSNVRKWSYDNMGKSRLSDSFCRMVLPPLWKFYKRSIVETGEWIWRQNSGYSEYLFCCCCSLLIWFLASPWIFFFFFGAGYIFVKLPVSIDDFLCRTQDRKKQTSLLLYFILKHQNSTSASSLLLEIITRTNPCSFIRYQLFVKLSVLNWWVDLWIHILWVGVMDKS